MNFVTFDTTMKELIVSSKKNGQSKYTIDLSPQQHGVTLLPVISQHGSVEDFDVFACNIGPGSFTGIRIGVTTLKTICYAAKKKAVSINTFEVIAYNIHSQIDSDCLIIVDGGNKTYYVCTYVHSSKSFSEAKNIAIDDLQRYVFDSKCRFAAAKDLDLQFEGVQLVAVKDYHLALHGLVQTKIENAEFADFLSLQPLYIQLSQAERQIP